MKTETRKHDKCEVELTVTLEPAEIEPIVKKTERRLAQNAVLPGFRKGKVPLELLRREAADTIAGEISRAIMNAFLTDAIKQEKLEVVSAKEVTDFNRDDDGCRFSMTLDVFPQFSLPTYKGLKLGVKRREVTDADVEKSIASLRNVNSRFEDATEEKVAHEGDFVQIDYSGTIDGKSIAEIEPEAKVIAAAQGFWAQLERGHLPDEFIDTICGMKKGETKEGVEVDFDKFPVPESIKGKKAIYTMTLKMLRNRITPTDEELVQRMGSASYDALVGEIRQRLERDADSRYAAERQMAAEEMLLKKVDFPVPESSVARITDYFLQNFALQAQKSNIDAKYLEENREKILEDTREKAVATARRHFLFNAIAKAEKIECDEKEMEKKVIEFIVANAKD